MKLNIHPNMIQHAASHAALNPFSAHRGSTLLSLFGNHIENHMEFRELARVSTVNASHTSLSASFLPRSSTQGVHTRFSISRDMHTQQLRAKSDLAVIPHKRCGQTFQNGMKTQRFVGLKASKRIYVELKREKKARKALERKRVTKMKALSRQIDSLRASIRDAAKEIEATRDHYETLISNEKQRAEDAEMTRLVAVSSLRCRLHKQRSELEEEVASLRSQSQMLRKDLNAKTQEAIELQTSWEESLFDVDALKRKLAIMEDDEMMRLFSREISDALSEVSNVALLRPREGACTVDRFRELRDVVKELVREVVSRRKSCVKTAEKLCKLEDERLKWLGKEGICNEYHPLM